MNKIVDKKLYLIILGVIIEILFVLGVEGNISILKYLGLFLILVTLLFFEPNLIFSLFLFLLPNQRMIVFNSSISLLNIYLIFSFLLFSIKKKLCYDNCLLFSWIFLLSYSILLVAINEGVTELFIILKLLTFSIVFFSFFCNIRENISNITEVLMLYVFGVFVFLVVGFIGMYVNGSFCLFLRYSGGINNEPNTLGNICSFTIAVITVLRKYAILNIYLYFLFLVTCVFFGFITQSRSFLLSISVIALINLFRFKNIRLLLVFFPILSIMLFNANLEGIINNNTLLDSVYSRISEPRNGDVSGGRLDIWLDYINKLFESSRSFFWGVGNNSMMKFGFDQSPHNAILEDLCTFGFIGVCLIYFMLIRFYHVLLKYTKSDYFKYLPLLVFCLNAFTMHSVLSMGGICQFFISIIALSLTGNLKKRVLVKI